MARPNRSLASYMTRTNWTQKKKIKSAKNIFGTYLIILRQKIKDFEIQNSNDKSGQDPTKDRRAIDR
jgi:hypothetical protein